MNNDFLPAITSLWQVLWEGNFLIQKKTFIVEMSIFLESFPGKTVNFNCKSARCLCKLQNRDFATLKCGHSCVGPYLT